MMTQEKNRAQKHESRLGNNTTMTRNPKVLIIILNYRRYDLTIKIINELHSNLDYSNYSIMVVDNCSPDESAKVLEEKKDSMNFIFYANKNNSGYAAGNNIGIRYGIKNGYDYSWILNNDVEILDRDVLKQLISKAESDTSIACIGPKVYSSFNKAVPPFCNRPTLWSYSLGLKQERDYRRTQIDISRRVYCIYGCCVLLRNEAMKEIDCMDERTFLYDEEVYLGNQVKCIFNDDEVKRCYGVVANMSFILVCEYGPNGDNPEIIIYKAR